MTIRRTDWWWLVLPAGYFAHLGEEWWGGEGFASWTARVVGAPVSETRFIVVNSIAAPLCDALPPGRMEPVTADNAISLEH
jgi:hypothetical protein